ncbi:hypothetical protein BU25DRAFT_196986 [Macroventuria anomochaeta]|uniref:Uncharacterized protein n=1 Tax=Macroventuria anomochaeta TaxID=301207 RepID=A0ACB6SEV3_9PLEO|nr:uncharacterized protein BU25DRAFT_196986 [Macroventuria anomochaeta]KAF2631794.1 hypothetical protein BU25DRAFT_196986 [Macroventuria anomochaeta]
MDDLSYTTGQLNGYGFPTGDGGLRNDMAHPYHNNTYTQQSPTSQAVFSPIDDSRHDSVYSLSPSQSWRLSIVQQHKAAFQPDAARLTPHVNTAQHQSEDMSREASRASYQSSMSSGQQFQGSQQLLPSYHNDFTSSSNDMRRTVSIHPDTSALQNQHFRAYPVQHQMYTNHFSSDSNNVYPSAFSTLLPHNPLSPQLDDSVIDSHLNDAVDLNLPNIGAHVFGPGPLDIVLLVRAFEWALYHSGQIQGVAHHAGSGSYFWSISCRWNVRNFLVTFLVDRIPPYSSICTARSDPRPTPGRPRYISSHDQSAN